MSDAAFAATADNPAPLPSQEDVQATIEKNLNSPLKPPDNAFQQEIIKARHSGYSWDQINEYVATQTKSALKQGYTQDQINQYMGFTGNPKNFDMAIGPVMRQRAQENPPVIKSSGNPAETFMNTILNYSSIGLLAHGTKLPDPQPEAQGIWDRLQQAAGYIVGAYPFMWAGARTGAIAGTEGGPPGMAAGALVGAVGGLFVDSYVRNSYGTALKQGDIKGPADAAERIASSAWAATKETAPAALAMTVGGPAAGLVAKAGGGVVAQTTARVATELTAMTAASSAIQQQLPSWEDFLDNAIVLSVMHAAPLAAKGVAAAKDAAAKAAQDKAELSRIQSISRDLIDNWMASGERPADAISRIQKDTSFGGAYTKLAQAEGQDALAKRVTEPGAPAKAPEEVATAYREKYWDALGIDSLPLNMRTRVFDSAVNDGVEATKARLEASKGDPEKFNELRRADAEAAFKNDPLKYGGDLDTHLTRLDSRPPTSPDELAARAAQEDGQESPFKNIIVPEKKGFFQRGGVLHRIFNPETIDKNSQSAVATIRAATGWAARATAQARAAVPNSMAREVNAKPDVMPLIDYIEGRGEGAKLPAGYESLQPAADVLKDIFERRRAALETQEATSDMSFVDDYFPHMWKDPEAARTFLAGRGKEGSTRNLKARSIPTVSEGIAAGLEPKYDPLSTALLYASNMDKVIATHAIFETGKANGDIVYSPAGKAPDGWIALNGRLGTKSTPVGPLVAYAPEGFARVYNNFVSRGFGDASPDLGNAYTAVQRANNFVTALKLTLSAYHAVTMTSESFVNGLAQGIDEAIAGKPLKGITTALLSPFRMVTAPFKGKALQDIYLYDKPVDASQLGKSEQDQRIVDIITEAGGRMAPSAEHSIDTMVSGSGSLVTSFLRGTLGTELVMDAQEAAGKPVSGTAKVLAKNIGRVMQTAMQPLFEKYIPLLKNAALYEHVASWISTHPEASHAEIVAATRKLVDRVDERFGEAITDNIFMNKLVKQVGMASMLSWSWTGISNVRGMGGGVADTFKAITSVSKGQSPEITNKMTYLIALPLATGMLASIYQYLKIGEWPQDLRDFMAPRTGGEHLGQPERALMPGFMKDIFGVMEKGLTGEAYNKLSPGIKDIAEVLSNKDWRGFPIRNDSIAGPWLDSVPEWLKNYWEYAQAAAAPIVVTNIMNNESDSGFSVIEQALGIRRTLRSLSDPEGFEALELSLAHKAWEAKTRADAKAKARQSPQDKLMLGPPPAPTGGAN